MCEFGFKTNKPQQVSVLGALTHTHTHTHTHKKIQSSGDKAIQDTGTYRQTGIDGTKENRSGYPHTKWLHP